MLALLHHFLYHLLLGEQQGLALNVLPFLFSGRSKTMRGKCTPEQALNSFIDWKAVSLSLSLNWIIQKVNLYSLSIVQNSTLKVCLHMRWETAAGGGGGHWGRGQNFCLLGGKGVDQSNSYKVSAKYSMSRFCLCNFWQSSLLFERWRVNMVDAHLLTWFTMPYMNTKNGSRYATGFFCPHLLKWDAD